MTRHYSPLRYPGGKGGLVSFFRRLLRANDLCGAHYAEAYAGGAGVALALLMTEYASHIHLNDLSSPLHCFWRSAVEFPEELCRRIADTPVTPKVWQKQKNLLRNPAGHHCLDVGFAFFFLNRTNRSGVLNGGMIGGCRQDGRWRIDARFNKKQLIQRIERIADYRHRISLYNLDAQDFLANVETDLPDNTLLYLDPPYFEKGQHLYENAYTPEGHKAIARIVQTQVHHPWVVTYDECEQVRFLYSGRQYLSYGLRYSARRHRIGKEVMFLSDSLRIPEAFLAPLPAASGPSL